MKIKKLKVVNYKILKDITIDFQDTNIFVGENDAGKSTILQALMMVLTGRLDGIAVENCFNLNWFNTEIREIFRKAVKEGEVPDLPEILIEAYFTDSDDMAPELKGTNNLEKENELGVRLSIAFNQAYDTVYKNLLNEKQIEDIPVEYYSVTLRSFAGSGYRVSDISRKVIMIDTTKKRYDFALNHFMSDSIDTYLTEMDKAELRRVFRANRQQFAENEMVVGLNEKLCEKRPFGDKQVSVDLREDKIDDWKNYLALKLDQIPFEYTGVGLQKMLKTELFLGQQKNVDILLMEEPENNLSYANMAMLISKLAGSNGKQLFISTHSSFVANKLGLQYLYLVAHGQVSSFHGKVGKDTYEYFMKLPGYNTLRVLLAPKVILVEGPTDDLIMQRAYLDYYGKLPLDDGIDVIAVSGVAFQPYCDLAEAVSKHIILVTDNDKNPEKVRERYQGYIDKGIVTLCMEENPDLHTIEPCVVDANCENLLQLQTIVYKKSQEPLGEEKLIGFMEKNKALWGLRVFSSEERIKYPKYICDAIHKAKEERYIG